MKSAPQPKILQDIDRRLTEKQKQVLESYLVTANSAESAVKLNISQSAVISYLLRIKTKLGVTSYDNPKLAVTIYQARIKQLERRVEWISGLTGKGS